MFLNIETRIPELVQFSVVINVQHPPSRCRVDRYGSTKSFPSKIRLYRLSGLVTGLYRHERNLFIAILFKWHSFCKDHFKEILRRSPDSKIQKIDEITPY